MVARLMRHCDAKQMSPTSPTPPVILIAAPQEHSLSSVLQDTQYSAAVQVHTGTLALAWAPDLRPDTIILDADLPDMSGIDACRLLHNDLRLGNAGAHGHRERVGCHHFANGPVQRRIVPPLEQSGQVTVCEKTA